MASFAIIPKVVDMDTIIFFHTSQREAWRRELAGAYRFARARGWRIQVVEPPDDGSAPEVKRLAEFWAPIGCIAECSGRGGDLLTPRLFRRLPTVFLGSDPATLPKTASFVAPAAKGVGAAAAREFLRAGLSSFGFIATAGEPFWSRDRRLEFAETVRLHGFECATFADNGKSSFQSRAAALSAWLSSLAKPCGVFAENDYAAAEALDIARRIGLAVPREISVIGVDNDSKLCENAIPTLTSVALDFEWAGYRASEILDTIVRNPGIPAIRETYPALGIARRGSTPAGDGVPPRITGALAYIREHACDGIGVAEVAALLPGSRRKAEIEFRRFTGHSIYDEIGRVRFENVELLLRDRYRAIDAIASLCGWKTENALRAAFRKRYGMPMREWRRMKLEGQ